MGNDGLKSSSSKHHNNNLRQQPQQSKDEDDIEFSKPQSRMNKIRRSLSFRKKKNKKEPPQQPIQITTSAAAIGGTTITATTEKEKYTIDTTKPISWQEDERKVRDGTCSFHVKYLGAIEVFDSRGMHVCEQAIERQISSKSKPIKAILYVSGDSLRVVDETNKTLIVDQTIEKVSFCAPDRFHDNGFAYICRDGTTRRWLCHGFLAVKETIRSASNNSSGGERLSHAVGCAFSVCLERKQKRERENVTMEVGKNYSFTRLGSFRQASLTERLEDPQIVIPAAEPTPIKRVDNPYAIERPKGNVEILSRQNSLRSYQGPFKRNTSAYTSLKPGELPSFQAQKLTSMFNKTPTVSQPQTNEQKQESQIEENSKINTINELPEETIINEPANSIIQPPNTPPPLPPMPSTIYRSILPNQQTTKFNNNDLFNSLPLSPPPSATFWNQQQQHNIFNSPTINNNNSQQSIFSTPYQQVVYNYPQQPITPVVPANETFEAKWARLQASKKQTNPFAEDIAKKYEIKL